MDDRQIKVLFQRLGNAYASIIRSGRAKQIPRTDPIWLFMNEVGQVINAYSRLPKTAEDIRTMVVLASAFDSAGAHAMADVMDDAANMLAGLPRPAGLLSARLLAAAQEMDDNGQFSAADILDKASQYVAKFAECDKSPFKPLNEISLSTRYCPDHAGVQAFRVADNSFQCPLDGRIYNYENGYTDYEGRKVPGGTVAEQTPFTAPFGIPSRLYDSRQSVINTIN